MCHVPGYDRRNPIISMGVRRDARVRRHAKHYGVHAGLIRIAFQDNCLYAADSRTPSTRIAPLRKLILFRSKAFFADVATGSA